MMLIIRKEKVQKSVIVDKDNYIMVKNLPEGLRNKMTKLLDKLPVESINITNKRKIEKAVLKISNEKVLLEDYKNVGGFIEQIGLLMWFLGPHWNSLGILPKENNLLLCVDCDASVSNGSKKPQSCPNRNCLSHRKFRTVLGKDYKKPKKNSYF